MTKKNVNDEPAIRVATDADAHDPVYLVLERDPFVAEDIIASLQAIGPCRVIRVDTECNIRETLADEADVKVAFLDVKYAQVRAKRLDEMLLTRGAKIVLTVGEDDEDQATADGWGMLIRPFTERMIQNAVAERQSA